MASPETEIMVWNPLAFDDGMGTATDGECEYSLAKQTPRRVEAARFSCKSTFNWDHRDV